MSVLLLAWWGEYIYVCVYVCMYVYVCVCVYIYVYICIYIYIYVYICVYMYIYVYVRLKKKKKSPDLRLGAVLAV